MRSFAWLRLISRRQTFVGRADLHTSRSLSQRLDIVSELETRGLVAAFTSPEIKKHAEQPITIYCGVDPSASTLHVGNLLPLTTLLRFQAAGHRVISVIGGATGSIGDPSGRSTERNALPAHELESNIASITAQVQRIFANANAYLDRKGKGIDRGERKEVLILNNLDWTRDITMLDFLRTVGKMARINTMIAREAVKTRLDSQAGISFTEFTYQLLQANDFSHLFHRHDCTIQLGGSDQWGNIVAGIDLIRRQAARESFAAAVSGKAEPAAVNGHRETSPMLSNEDTIPDPAYGLTLPLLTTKNGQKFGKSAGNAVGLDGSPIAFWQFWFRVEDDSVLQYLKMFTFLPLEHIDAIWCTHMAERRERHAQRALADAVTEMVHGEEGLQRAIDAQQILYRVSPGQLKSKDVVRIFQDDSHLVPVKWSDLEGVPIGKLMAQYGMVKSRNEASQQMEAGAFYINDHHIKDKHAKLNRNQHIIDQRIMLFRLGPNKRIIFQVEFPEADDGGTGR